MNKASTLSGISDKLNALITLENIGRLRSFFMGKWYPIWVAVSVLLGRMLGLELYFAMLDFVIVSVALLLCDSVRPVIPNLISFLYRISLEHGPGYPYHSRYYTGTKMIFFALFASLFFVTLTYFFIKNRSKLFGGVTLKNIPLLLPLALFSVSFLMGGAFSGQHKVDDFGFAALQVFVFFVVFLILYFGLRTERVDNFCDYFVYICAVVAVVLSWEIIEVLFTVDNAIIGGAINKEVMNFGWGISNTAGSAVSVLIPICILGAMKSKKYSVVYFLIGTLSLITTAITLSRSSVLCGGVFYVVALIISCFVGDNKKTMRIASLSVVVLSILLVIFFKDELDVVFTSFVSKGFSNNGRYYHWRVALDNFKSAPIFGIGFFSFGIVSAASSTFTPSLAHNTPLQLLSSMGVFGLATYVYYRVCTLIPFFKRPNKEKMMLMLSGGVLIGESLIDNFIFWFSPTFVYNILIVIAFMYCEQKNQQKGIIADPIEPVTTL